MEYKAEALQSREVSEGVLSVYINTWWKGKIQVGARLFSVMACDKTRNNVYKSNTVGSMWTQQDTFFFLLWIKTGTDCTEMLWDLQKIQSTLKRNTYIVLGHILTYHTNHSPVLNWERWTLSHLIKTAPLLFVWFFFCLQRRKRIRHLPLSSRPSCGGSWLPGRTCSKGSAKNRKDLSFLQFEESYCKECTY